MICCKEVAKLLTSDQLSQMGFIKRIEVTLHIWMCRHCSRFAKQINQLRSASRKISFVPEDENKSEGSEESLEARLLRNLTDKNR
ncbi:MAG: hypothetical protein U0V70_07200 [Terriglobia bacterium]